MRVAAWALLVGMMLLVRRALELGVGTVILNMCRVACLRAALGGFKGWATVFFFVRGGGNLPKEFDARACAGEPHLHDPVATLLGHGTSTFGTHAWILKGRQRDDKRNAE